MRVGVLMASVKLYELINVLNSDVTLSTTRKFMLKSPHIIVCLFLFVSEFKRISNFSKNVLILPSGDLYMHAIVTEK